jgi:5'-nucleotidase / UDP-sugar diphosphatase
VKTTQEQYPVGSARPSRREFVARSVVASATILLYPDLGAAAEGKKTFTILHTNDLHSNLIGMAPVLDYAPTKTNDDDDETLGGFARLATLIAERKSARKDLGPVLVVDAGDYSMGTAFGAATRETGAELQLLFQMGYDAVTLGNHDFDLGSDGLGQSIGVAAKAGRVPPVVASNTSFPGHDPTLADLQRLTKDGVIRRYLVIERGGIRFGIFGLLGKEAIFFASSAGATSFSDPFETAKEMVTVLRETENVDVVICLSHGGVAKGKDGHYSEGDDIRVAQMAPGIDVVIGGHSHIALQEPIMVNGRTPVVQAGKYGEHLGELVITVDGSRLTVESYQIHPIDNTVLGDRVIEDEIDKLKKTVTEVVFASRGYSFDQPLAVAPRDVSCTYTDIAASTPLANLVTDAFRNATKADIGITAAALIRTGLTRGKSGIQTVYDVFAVAPIGAGVVDSTAGSALVTAYFTGLELKHLLEFMLANNPDSGELFPRASGMRFRYDPARPKYDVVTAIEIGDLDRGYCAIDISANDEQLYSVTTSLYMGKVITAIPKYSKGELAIVAKNKNGQPLKSSTDALSDPRRDTPDLLPPPATTDVESVDTVVENGAIFEIKEWQAVMDHIRGLPVKSVGELPVIPVDGRAAEVRAIIGS